MAVISVNLYRPATGGGGRKPKDRSYTEVYRVITNSAFDDTNTVRFASGVPAYGEALSTDPGVYVTNKTAELRDESNSRYNWNVTVTYGAEDDSCSDQQYDSPLDEPAQVSGTTATFSKVIDKDVNGKPIASSAGELFDPPIEIDDHRHVVRITKNVAKTAFNLETLSGLKDCLNDSEFWGMEAGKVKFVSFDWEKKYLGTCAAFYFVVTFEFEVDPKGYDLVLIDRGFSELNSAGTDKKVILGDDGQPLNQPSFLDGAGKKLAADLDPVELDPFEIYEKKSFSPLTTMGVPDPLWS